MTSTLPTPTATAHGVASSSSWLSPGAGITAGYNGQSESLRIVIIFLSGLAIYNAVELIAMISLTFTRHRGLYFWSLLIASIGIIPYSLGFLLKFDNITPGDLRWLAVFLLTIGWYPMITGQSLVLWSRLHLIVSGERGDRILRWTKWMIIVNAIALHIPTTVLTFGSNGDIQTDVFVQGYNVMEKIQMVGFFVQEIILSSIYIYETVKLLRLSLQPNTKRTMYQLITINVVIIVMDLGLLGIECASLYILETLVKGVIYSIKLKLEFAILGKLVRFAVGQKSGLDGRATSIGFVGEAAEKKSGSGRGDSDGMNDMNIADFVDLNRMSTNITYPSRGSDCQESATRRKTSRISNTTDWNFARFQHVEDVSSLGDDESRASSRAASPCDTRMRAKTGEGEV
ncbi:hypothetical protein Q7P37_002518 [Cladosporium fusiforme]